MTSAKDLHRQKHQKKTEEVKYKDPNAHIVAMQNGEVDEAGKSTEAKEEKPEPVVPETATKAEAETPTLVAEEKVELPEYIDPNSHIVSMQKGEVDEAGNETVEATQEVKAEAETPQAEAPVVEEAKTEIEEELPKDPNAHMASVHKTEVPESSDEKKN